MRIGLHMAMCSGFGSAAVARNVLEHFVSASSGHSVEAWVPASWRAGGWRPPKAIRNKLCLHEVGRGLWAKFATENLNLRRSIASGRIDVLFSLGDTSLPACAIPHLLLVQQAFLAYERVEWGFRPPPGFSVKMALMASYLRLGLPSVTTVTVQTEHMKRHFCERWNWPASQIAVVPSAIECMDKAVATARPKPYVVYVASPGPHKNFGVLPQVMSALRRAGTDLDCVLTVSRDDVSEMYRDAQRLGVDRSFVFWGPCAAEVARSLLAGAVCLVMPSKLESFGLPYFEALQQGCPVVAADVECAREACGGAARYASADSGEAFAEQIIEIREGVTRACLIEEGRKRIAAAPAWGEVAERYLKLLGSLSVRTRGARRQWR